LPVKTDLDSEEERQNLKTPSQLLPLFPRLNCTPSFLIPLPPPPEKKRMD